MKSASIVLGAILIVSGAENGKADDWSAISLGAYAEITRSDNSASAMAVNQSALGAANSISGDDTGWGGGVALSGSWRLQDTVFGISIDADPFGNAQGMACRYRWADGLNSNVLVSDQRTAGCNRDIAWSASVVGRVGLLTSESTLLYGLGGWTISRIKQDFTWPDSLHPVSATLSGATVGAGIEHRLTEHWHMAAEFRAMMFESTSTTIVSKELDAPQVTEIGGTVERSGLAYSTSSHFRSPVQSLD